MMRPLLAVSILFALIILCTGRAEAYPQYQLSHDATCTGCHLSPGGGGLLNENGFTVSEAEAWKPGDSSFFYGVDQPSWLQLGGDLRAAAGAVGAGALGGAAYPMQAEVHATAGARGVTLNVTGGLRRPQEGGSAAHVLWSRQHYVMWQQNAGSNEGLYIRAGRFMPVYGLRLAEHVAYTQRFGGSPLYGETYSAAVEYVTPRFEVHATGFLHDGLSDSPERGDGGALYAETRIGEHVAIGAEGKYASSDELHRTFAGLIGKLYLPGPDVLLQAEAEIVRQKVVVGDRSYNQLLAYVLATRPIAQGWLLDVGVGHYTQDTSVQGNYRDCFDANVHWFMTSHLEALVTTRLELLGSGPTGGYALVQLHYRL